MSDERDEIFDITDFRMAGFLMARGVPFLRTEINVRGEVVFIFDNRPNKEGRNAQTMLHLYPNSPEQKYDAACRTMHDMVKMTGIRSRK